MKTKLLVSLLTLFMLPNNVDSNQKINKEIINYSYVDIVSMNSINIDIEYGSYRNVDTALYIEKEYGSIIKKYSDMYGLDYNIVLAIATQESGSVGHVPYVDDGGAIGLMQIQYNSWIGEKLTAYNYDIDDYETVIVDESIKNVDQNIKIGCMIFQFELRKYDYNLIAGLQSYNYGGVRVKKIMQYSMNYYDDDYDEIVSDFNNLKWLDYRENVVKVGDNNYVENVLRWYRGNGNIYYQSENKKYYINLNKKILVC